MSNETKFPKIIAVDFDGTLVENKYPEIGETKEDVLTYCKEEQADGTRIILWTNRVGKYLAAAAEWCEAHGLHLDAVNDNLPEVKEFFGNDTRKVFANEYIDDLMCTKFRFAKPEQGSATSWAEREVKLAIAKLKEDKDDEGKADYLSGCYESALKAYQSLMDDGHSGHSIHIAKNLLNRLINGQCLTPIEDTPDIWNEVKVDKKGGKHYQCKRMGSLFKDVNAEGKVFYDDIDRVQAVDVSNPNVAYHNGFITALVNKIFPIEMPYFPDNRKFKVYREEFLTDEKNGDYDTMALLYILTPDGKKVELNRYFKDDPNGDSFIGITKEEYEERKARKIR